MANETAAWWDNPSVGSGDVVRHAPDDDQYHRPDQQQLGHMRLGLKAVTVPRARDDGRSMAFDPTRAGVVHVDPDAPDGGVVVDLARVSRQDVYEAVRSSHYPHQAFYKLGGAHQHQMRGQTSALHQEELVGNLPPLPGAVRANVPSAAQIVSPISQGPLMAPVAAQPMVQPMTMPAMQPPAPANQPMPQQFVMQDPALLQVIQQLNMTVAAMGQRLQTLETPQPAMPQPRPSESAVTRLRTLPPEESNGPARRVSATFDDSEENIAPIGARVRRNRDRNGDDEEEPRQPRYRREPDYREEEESPREGQIVGFESLEISFLTGPRPEKARRQVFYEIPAAGKMSAFYHDVIEGNDCVVLVYDSRYTEGTQYAPPETLEEPMRLHVPHLKKTFTVMSAGISYSFGVLDFVVLLTKGTEDLDYQQEERGRGKERRARQRERNPAGQGSG